MSVRREKGSERATPNATPASDARELDPSTSASDPSNASGPPDADDADDTSEPRRPEGKRTLLPTFDADDLARAIGEERSKRPTPFDPAAYARIVGPHRLEEAERFESASAKPPPNLDPDEVEEPTSPHALTSVPKAPLLPGQAPMTRSGQRPAVAAPSPGRVALPPWPQAQARAQVTPAAFDDQTVERADSSEIMGRQMYGFYLASDFPSALALAQMLLARHTDHALAQLVVEQCRERITPSVAPVASNRVLRASSVLRLKATGLVRHAAKLDPTASLVLDHIDGVADAATVAALTGLPDDEALERLNQLLDLGLLEVVNS